MTRYLLDADYVIGFLAGRDDAVKLIGALLPQGSSLAAVTAAEVIEGVLGGRSPDSAQRAFDDLVQSLVVFDMDLKVAYRVAEIRRQLRSSKKQVDQRALDILIAATAIEHDLILVTRNIRHFQDIEGLLIFTNDPS